MRVTELGRTGLKVPAVGFGGGPFGGFYGSFDEAEGISAIHLAIERGMNLIDTSPYYGGGRSEEVIGKGLEGGWRERAILATKCGRIAKDKFDFTAAGIKAGVETSLRLLRTDHVDILQAHDIEFEKDLDRVFDETFKALESLKRQGKCRFIGMTGYPVGMLVRAIESCALDVVISYCHATLLDQTMLERLVPVARRRGTGIINASPMSMGLLTMAGPPEWHPAPGAVKEACRRAAAVCARRGADLSDLALAYPLSKPEIATTLVGIKDRAEVERNLAAAAKPLDQALLAEVMAELRDVQGACWDSGHWKAGT
ncbi:MAG: aldo/keto reductase [Planctomycetes bacterium]|nr:aldo/keto reductase [Planctomycetota bacterium]